MQSTSLAICLLFPLLGLYGEPTLTARKLSIGKNLQTYTTISLSEPAPAEGLPITIRSADPQRLLVSRMPDAAGAPSLTLNIRAGFRESPEFWLHALDDHGEAAYTASAAGFQSATGTAELTPSGLILVSPFGDAAAPVLATTPRGWPAKFALRVVRLDSSLHPAEPQYIRGGLSVDISLVLSDPTVGSIQPPTLTIAAAEDSASAQFQPAKPGKAALTIKPSIAFHAPASRSALAVLVKAPGISVADDMMVGQNLQLAAALSLGEPAPPGGVKVKLASSDPAKLLLSASETEVGSGSIEIEMPAGTVTRTYYLQSLSPSGTVTHTASAEGFATRTGALMLAPSGVIVMLEKHGPPDEAEVFRPESAGSRRNYFTALLSEKAPARLVAYTAYLSPATKRSADITVQPLRAGMSLKVAFENSNPAVGTIASTATINAGSDRGFFFFKPLKTGETVISVLTPAGFTQPSNATELVAIVRE